MKLPDEIDRRHQGDPDQMKRILTVTLNPAIDVTTSVAKLVPGIKLRCGEPTVEPGGGGVNVSRVIKELGGETTALVAVAGATGFLMRELLAEAGIDTIFLEGEGMTRHSFAVHDRASGEQFRFVLPGPEQDGAFAERAFARLDELLASGRFPYIVGSGSLPPGMPDDSYGTMARIARRRGARLILDASGSRLRAALDHGVFLVRTNDKEAEALAGEMGLDAGDPETMARAVVRAGGAEIVIVTLGIAGALVVSKAGTARIRPPAVEVVSAVGAGDSFVGALSLGLSEGWPLERACSYGVAAAAAACTTAATELAYKTDIDRLHAMIGDVI